MRFFRVALSVALFGACGYDWTVVPKRDAGTTEDAGTAEDAGSSDGTTVDSGGSPPIACRMATDCPDTTHYYCVFPDRRCGRGVAGTCAAVGLTTACQDAPPEVVCSCDDGALLKSRCQAAAFALDLAVDTKCVYDEPGYVRCGFLYCVDRKESCVESVDAGTLDYHCAPR